MVRAKVALIRLAQSDLTEGERVAILAQFDLYLRQAERYTAPAAAALLITHGLSGSGKSSQTGACIQALPAIRLRSDIERKRLAGLQARNASASPPQGGIYSAGFSKKTYDHLRRQAKALLQAGLTVIVDATFLKQWQRDSFRALAGRLGRPFLMLDFQLPEEELRLRVRRRQAAGEDPSEADLSVLAHQLAVAEPLTPAEQDQALVIGLEPLSLEKVRSRISCFVTVRE
jgi:hypothetical protein